jgi:cytochrome c peroxidase
MPADTCDGDDWLLALVLTIPLGLDLYMPVPEENPITNEKIELGRRLFHDRRLSRDRSIACVSCHDPDRAFTDGRPVALGILKKLGRRSAPALINRGYGRAFFWDGRAASLEEQVLQPIQDPNEMGMTLEEVRTRVGLPPDEISRALARLRALDSLGQLALRPFRQRRPRCALVRATGGSAGLSWQG